MRLETAQDPRPYHLSRAHAVLAAFVSRRQAEDRPELTNRSSLEATNCWRWSTTVGLLAAR
jgi:hypothetical protein